MIIHVVEPGDYLYKIGRKYNIDYRKIIETNELDPNKTLVSGETLVIMTDGNNEKNDIEVNGYAYTDIDINLLTKNLEYLTYLSIFSYHINTNGKLTGVNDEELIKIAKNNRVLPVMVVTNIGKNDRFDSDLVHYILENTFVQEMLINEIVNTMTNKGYLGLNIDFEYIYPEDREEYIKFLSKIKNRISEYGYFLFVSVAPKTSSLQQGILYEAHDYLRIGYIADRVIIMTYEWGYSGGEASAIAPIYEVKKVLDYAVTVIPSDKILLGIPNYGYDWTLPFVEGTFATSVSNVEAIDIARRNFQRISYDEKNQVPYFNYIDEKQKKHEVWFEDARSIKAKFDLVKEYNLKGISYWTLNRPFPINYLVLKTLYNINKY